MTSFCFSKDKFPMEIEVTLYIYDPQCNTQFTWVDFMINAGYLWQLLKLGQTFQE